VVVAGTPSGVVVGWVVVVCVVVGAGVVAAGSVVVVCVVVLVDGGGVVVVCASEAVERARAAAVARQLNLNVIGGLPAFELEDESTSGAARGCTPNGSPFRVPDERPV
jgi:hypothetical protein